MLPARLVAEEDDARHKWGRHRRRRAGTATRRSADPAVCLATSAWVRCVLLLQHPYGPGCSVCLALILLLVRGGPPPAVCSLHVELNIN